MKADILKNVILKMLNHPVKNYVLPGLTSYLVGGQDGSKIRLFDASRDTDEWVIPHDHRFEFAALVLRGSVVNTLFIKTHDPQDNAYAVATVRRREGWGFGTYDVDRSHEKSYWHALSTTYYEGTSYGMTANDVHSIKFSKDALVLFFEGPTVKDSSIILEPYDVPTFTVADWMFT